MQFFSVWFVSEEFTEIVTSDSDWLCENGVTPSRGVELHRGGTAMNVALIQMTVLSIAWWTEPSSMARVSCKLRISESVLVARIGPSIWLVEEGWTAGALLELIGGLQFCSVLWVLFLAAGSNMIFIGCVRPAALISHNYWLLKQKGILSDFGTCVLALKGVGTGSNTSS